MIVTVRNEVAKVMFLQACVCPRGGVWSGLGGVCTCGSALGGAWSPGGVGIPACTEADPLGETANAVDGMYATGMHSCF